MLYLIHKQQLVLNLVYQIQATITLSFKAIPNNQSGKNT